jgi:integrase
MRGQGTVYRPKVRRTFKPQHKHFKKCSQEKGCYFETRVWWLDYSVGGTRHQESSKLSSKADAQRMLRERIGGRESGKLNGRPDRVTLADLQALHEKQYDLDGLRSKERMLQCWKQLVAFFPAETCVLELTPTRRDDYAVARFAHGAARQTVKNELSMLRRAWKIAVEKELLTVIPVFKMPKINNARSGFFEDGDFAALVVELPLDIQHVIRFLRLTGWRRNEALSLTWDQVDWEGKVIRLTAADTKGKTARLFPFSLAPDLLALIEERRQVRNGRFVFHREGQRIGVGALRSAWKRGCLRAGLATIDPTTRKVTLHRIVHDLRRSAARDFRRAGVSEGETMKLCGWLTRAMFDRYNIIDEADLAAAVAKRFTLNKRETTGVPQPN